MGEGDKKLSRKKLIELAKGYEEKADTLKSERKKDDSTYKEIINLYEKAGDNYLGAWMTSKAQRTYDLALRYAYGEDEKRINKKLQAAGLKKTEGLSPRRELGLRLETKFVFAGLSVITLVSALFFISFSFTGNVTLGLTDATSRWAGLCLFVCGLIFTFFYLRQK